MSVTGHTVQNASTNLFAELTGAAVVENPLHPPPPIGTRSQNWRFLSIDSDRNLYKIQSVFTSAYAYVEAPIANQPIRTSLNSLAWEVVVVGNSSPNFIIRLPNTNLVWTVPIGSLPATNITVNPIANNTNQHWKLTNV